MYNKLNWNINHFLGKNHPLLLITILFLIGVLFVQATSSQYAEVIAKSKIAVQGNDKKAYFALSKIGSSFPCGVEIGIALEDFGRYILSAQSGFLATVLPGDTMHTKPQTDGWGGGKLKNPMNEIEKMNYQSAYDRTKKLLIGTFEGTYGKRWAITDSQAKELYKQVHQVNLGGEEFTAFDHNNMFYEGLISTQLLINKTEEQAALIDNLIERVKHLEEDNYPRKAVGKIAINPNPSGDNYLNLYYSLYEEIRYASFTIKDIQGKQLYKVDLEQTNGNLQIDNNLPKGIYFCYLNNNSFQSTAQKLIIQ